MFCPNCGAQLEDTAKFCMRCGAAIGSASSPRPAAPVAPPPAVPPPAGSRPPEYAPPPGAPAAAWASPATYGPPPAPGFESPYGPPAAAPFSMAGASPGILNIVGFVFIVLAIIASLVATGLSSDGAYEWAAGIYLLAAILFSIAGLFFWMARRAAGTRMPPPAPYPPR